MGNILAFVLRNGAGTGKAGKPEAPASIIIFPGVRYERRDESDPGSAGSATAGSTGRRRSRKS